MNIEVITFKWRRTSEAATPRLQPLLFSRRASEWASEAEKKVERKQAQTAHNFEQATKYKDKQSKTNEIQTKTASASCLALAHAQSSSAGSQPTHQERFQLNINKNWCST